jgi:putative nucleotidyltransferase with HDIG domain
MGKKEMTKETDYKTILNEVIASLARIIDVRDTYTSNHSIRVAEGSSMLATRIGYSKEEVELVYRAGLLHDIGKIGVPEGIINKQGKLSKEEFERVKIHTVLGYHILSGISWDPRIAEAAKYHHERYNGKGYPNGLVGNNIPEIARIIAIDDAYDAMSSTRPYRTARPIEYIKEEIEKNLGEQFDPVFGREFINLLNEGKLPSTKKGQQKILIVDDEPINAEILKKMISADLSLDVFYCSNGKDAINLVKAGYFDLLLLDIYMPDMNGFEVFKEIRSFNKDIPAIFLTADKTKDTIDTAFEFGVVDYLTKPYSQEIVLAVIHAILSKKPHLNND